MSVARPLSSAFVAAAAAAASGAEAAPPEAVAAAPRASDALEAALAQAVARGAAAWPDVPLDPATFAAWLGPRVAEDALDAAEVSDLWLACACLADVGPALRHLDRRYLAALDAPLAKSGVVGAQADEVKQAVRALVVVGAGGAGPGGGPKLAEYRGAGPLGAWLRVTALRAAFKLAKRAQREAGGSDDALLGARAEADDPELAYMKATYRAAFREAFQEALDSLEGKERALLKQQVVDGLSVDDLGALWQVHRATAARWVASAREKLLARTRRAFQERLRLSTDECESVMRLVQSQLDVSLHRRLAGADVDR